MKKSLKILLIMLIFMPCVFFFSACSNKFVVDISRSANSTDNAEIYTITYSDGSTSSFEVSDGKDGKDVDVEQIYRSAKANGFTGTFMEFLDLYLDVEVSNTTENINKAMLSTVAIDSEFITYDTSTNNYAKATKVGCGSGVIYKLDKSAGNAYIITNYHVVYNASANTPNKIASKIKCFLYGADSSYSVKTNELGIVEKDSNGYPIVEYSDNAIDCEYVGGSMDYDIAVLKVTNSNIIKNYDCFEAKIEDSNNVTIGSSAYAIGNPDGLGISVTSGVVCVDSEYLSMTGADNVTNVVFRVMRIDSAVNAGNSGGGLFDNNGKLIGIVNAKIIDTKVENIGYAIPSNIATRIADNIIKYCNENNKKPYKATLGITLEYKNTRSEYNQDFGKAVIKEDVYIKSITPLSLCSTTTLSEGDRIISVTIKGVKYEITRGYQLIDLVWLIEAGDVVTFGIKDKPNVSFAVTQNYFSYVK